MKKKALQKWFADHPAISPRRFGIEAGWAEGSYFVRWLKIPAEHGEMISSKVFRKIRPMLERYGISKD